LRDGTPVPMTRILFGAGLTMFLAPAGLSLAAPAESGAWNYSAVAATTRTPQVDLKDGGRTDHAGYHLRAGAERRVDDATKLAISLQYEVHDRDFSGAGGFGSLQAWDRRHRLGLGAAVTRRTRFGWSYGLRPFINWSFESGAFSDDAMSYGTAVAIAAGISRSKRLGAGALLYRDIHGSVKASPVILVDWDFNQEWTLGNPRELHFASPSGLEIRYRPPGNWQFALAGIYRSEDFRLDDNGIAPGGTGESSGVVGFLRATRRSTSGLTVSGYIGAVFDGELEVEDENGTRLAASKYETAPFVGLAVEGNF
jgi:hypothetical protein